MLRLEYVCRADGYLREKSSDQAGQASVASGIGAAVARRDTKKTSVGFWDSLCFPFSGLRGSYSGICFRGFKGHPRNTQNNLRVMVVWFPSSRVRSRSRSRSRGRASKE